MNLICGINPVLEALAAGARHFDRLIVAKGVRNRRVSEAMSHATQLGIPLRFEGRDALDRMANGLNHQGLIAVVSAKTVTDLESLLGQLRDPGLVVVLDGVEDPRNLGAIVRTVEASGADGLVLPERHTAPLSETVSRASAGALEHVRVARVGNLSQAIASLKERGLWVVGFDASGTDRWHTPDYKRPVALVFGGEGRGIRRLVRDNCDQIVSLPLFGQVASLNVSVVAGAALYEVVRQRGFVPSHVRPIPARPAAKGRQIIGPSPEDAEEDPGRIGPLLMGRASDTQAPGEAVEHEADEYAVSVIDLHEDVGWGRQVTVQIEGARAHSRRVQPAGKGGEAGRDGRREGRGPRGERGRPRRGDERRREERGRDERARQPPRDGRARDEGGREERREPPEGVPPSAPVQDAGVPAPGGAQPGLPAGRRRRRRRRGAPGGGEATGSRPRAAGEGTPEAAPREGQPPERREEAREGERGAPGPQDPERRRRRRRRRRSPKA